MGQITIFKERLNMKKDEMNSLRQQVAEAVELKLNLGKLEVEKDGLQRELSNKIEDLKQELATLRSEHKKNKDDKDVLEKQMLAKAKELHDWEKKSQELQSKIELIELEKQYDRETIAKFQAQEEEFAKKDVQVVELNTRLSMAQENVA